MATRTEVRIAGYSHVAIAVTDLATARRLLLRPARLRGDPRPDFGFPGMWLRVGDLQLHFLETDTMPVPGPGFPHLRAPRADRRLHLDDGQRSREAGVTFIGEPMERLDFGTTKVLQAFVADPAGNVVELTDMGPFAD